MPSIGSFFFSLCVVSLTVPLYSTHYIKPSFTQEFIEITEDEATRIARYLSGFFVSTESSSSQLNTRTVLNLLEDFDILKIKYFGSNGEITFSTDSGDIGKINTKEYFINIVQKGNLFTKIVKKGAKSMEGQELSMDVAEIYVPIMKDDTFIGAFELYYNISKRKRNLELLQKSSTVIAIVSSVLFFVVLIFFLFKSCSDNFKREALSRRVSDLNENLEEKVKEQTLEIKINQEITIETLAKLAEYYDSGTGKHLERVQSLVSIITKELSNNSKYAKYLSEKSNYVSEISTASIFHDVGKIGIDKEILMKPGKLTTGEFEEMKSHTTIGSTLLRDANKKFVSQFQKDSYLALVRDIAQCHHEKWDGTGYPFSLSGEDIPLSARIVALVDVYDALRSTRPYKKPWTHSEVENEIRSQKGKWFDPAVVDAFNNVSKKFELTYLS